MKCSRALHDRRKPLGYDQRFSLSQTHSFSSKKEFIYFWLFTIFVTVFLAAAPLITGARGKIKAIMKGKDLLPHVPLIKPFPADHISSPSESSSARQGQGWETHWLGRDRIAKKKNSWHLILNNKRLLPCFIFILFSCRTPDINITEQEASSSL